jgi:peptide chain release factor 2
MQMLKVRLYEVELQKLAAEKLAWEAAKIDIGWGHQIRSYVLQPYQLVKDLRPNVERTDPQKVLDGIWMSSLRRRCFKRSRFQVQ